MNFEMHIRAFILSFLLFPYASNTLADYFPNNENWDISSPEAEGVSLIKLIN